MPPPRKTVSTSSARTWRSCVELPQEGVDVRAVLVATADCRDEVAVAAPVRAEREVHVQVPDTRHASARFGLATSSPPQFGHTWSISAPHAAQNVHSCEQMTASPSGSKSCAAALAALAHLEAHDCLLPWPMLSTARNASCGTSTAPTCFIRFLPAFCFSSSLRLREMSPP